MIAKPENSKQTSRFKPRPCRACQALSKKKCIFCGQKWDIPKQDMTDWEILVYDSHVERMEYLKSLRDKAVTMNMAKFNLLPKNDGALDSLIAEIILWFGDWRN